MEREAGIFTERLPSDAGDLSSDMTARMFLERQLIRKLDSRLLPTVMLIYFMNFIDRTNVTAAKLEGMQDDLRISDIKYDTVLALMFVTYCICQVPSNMLLNRLPRPSLYIGCCVIFWGLASTLTGITTNYAGILICRLSIGVPEAAFYPGITYLLSRWYTKKELAVRSAIFFSAVLIANTSGNLIAAGALARMEGVRKIRAWRWLFYIEGSITIFVGIFTMWLLPDHPDNTRWLSAQERKLAQIRLAEDIGEADKDNSEESPLEGLKMALRDPLIHIFAFQVTTQSIGLSFVNFFPTLMKTLGFSITISLLLAAPPWLFAAILCCLNARHADKTGERFFHIAGCFWVAMIGFVIAISTMLVPARYISFFFMTSGPAGSALSLVWLSNTIPRPPAKRAAAIALVNGAGSIGTIRGSYVWKSAWGPSYRPSMVISTIALLISTSLQFVIRQILIQKNAKLALAEGDEVEANRTRIEEAAALQGISYEDALKKRKRFQYLY